MLRLIMHVSVQVSPIRILDPHHLHEADAVKFALQVLRETDPSTVTEHGLYERPVDKMQDEVQPPSNDSRPEVFSDGLRMPT